MFYIIFYDYIRCLFININEFVFHYLATEWISEVIRSYFIFHNELINKKTNYIEATMNFPSNYIDSYSSWAMNWSYIAIDSTELCETIWIITWKIMTQRTPMYTSLKIALINALTYLRSLVSLRQYLPTLLIKTFM